MLSHLRAQNRAIEKGLRSLEKYLQKIDSSMTLDERGRARIQYNQVGLHIHAIPDANLVIFKTFINFLPDPAEGTLLPLHYALLDLNDEPMTGLAYFSIVDSREIGSEHDAISVETKRPLADMSEEEFMQCVRAVGEVANIFMEKLEADFKAPRVP
ncbi:MAG: YbjN domain-containing protein [Chloroflexi bacterium]|nr:YbjN domain-containing protein [Chloroflexota bacterium]